MNVSSLAADEATPSNSTTGVGPFRRILWPLVKSHRWTLLWALLLNSMHGVAITFQTIVPKYLIDDVLPHRETAWVRLWWVLGIYLLMSLVVRMLGWHISMRMFTNVRERAVAELRAQFFRHVNHMCLRFHGRYDSGELFSYLFGTPLAKVQDFFRHVALSVPGAILTFVTTLAWLGAWDLPMTSVLTVSVGLSVWSMMNSERRVHDLWRDYQAVEGNVSATVVDLLRGNRAVKLYAMEHEVDHQFRNEVETLRAKVYHVDVSSHYEYMKQETISYFSFVVLCAVGTWRCLDGYLTTGEFLAYILSFFALQGPLTMFFQVFTMRAGARASLERIATVLDTGSSTPDPQGASEILPTGGTITLDHVHFAYETEPVLKDVSIAIPAGQRIALVGPSGSGKSTLSQLLLRLYDPTSGSIRIDGVDLRHCAGADIRRRFGVVPQDPFIFRTSVRDNVRVAKPDADDAAIRVACEKANAWEFIARLPERLDTRVGEGGSTLSGGQRQRLAIARALLADPPFFIFDEATSALDTVSESLIQDTLYRNLDGRTALFIAHRLSTVKNCDRILVLDAGRVVQDGTYDELVAQTGIFKDLVEGQKLR